MSNLLLAIVEGAVFAALVLYVADRLDQRGVPFLKTKKKKGKRK